MLISIVTPTFNRRSFLEALYCSLKKQTSKGFEWVVVDDGSTDETSEFIESINSDAEFEVNYIYKENGGKQRAVNLGVENSKGDYIFILDSDDCLVIDAIEYIKNFLNSFVEKRIDGVVFLYKSGNKKVELFKDSNSGKLSVSKFLKTPGDKGFLVRRDIMINNKFPLCCGEKFVTEAILWLELLDKFEFYYDNKVIHYGDYLSDGLSSKYKILLRDNKSGTFLFVIKCLNLRSFDFRLFKIAAYHYINVDYFFGLREVFNKTRLIKFLIFCFFVFALKVKVGFKK